MSELRSTFGASAYGGPGWSGRTRPLSAELGEIWADCGVGDEWSTLRAVLLHRPGPELVSADDPDAVQMLAPIDLGKAQAEHDAIAQAYRDHGVEVHLVARARGRAGPLRRLDESPRSTGRSAQGAAHNQRPGAVPKLARLHGLHLKGAP